MSRTTVAINSINMELDKISGLTEYVSPLVEGMNKQVKETVDLILAFERVNEKNDMLEAVIYLMAEELTKFKPFKGVPSGCLIDHFKARVKGKED